MNDNRHQGSRNPDVHRPIPTISIHAPRGGSDRCPASGVALPGGFQSTLPVGGATPRRQRPGCAAGDFNPRSPRGERPLPVRRRKSSGMISIHAPRGGSDPMFCAYIGYSVPISIHAPRGGSDGTKQNTKQKRFDFNPRSPWGERPNAITESLGALSISIHAPRGGSDIIVV